MKVFFSILAFLGFSLMVMFTVAIAVIEYENLQMCHERTIIPC